MIDVKVFSKYGPDDKIYDNNEKIRHRVARGNAFLVLEENKGPICTVFALKKFTGGLGDDDDRESGDDKIWKRYFSNVCKNICKSVLSHIEYSL